MKSSQRPGELLFAVSIASVIAFGWLHAPAVYTGRGARGDFGMFLGSARAFLDGARMYAASDGTLAPNLNPPHVHVLFLALARLTTQTAIGLWVLAGVLCLVASIRIVFLETGTEPRPWTLWLTTVAVVSSAATAGILFTGQVSWVLMLPVTLAWRAARRERWATAGALIGLAAAAKLFLLLLLPYLVLTRRWRAVIAAAVTGGLCVAAGLLVFGLQSYVDWMSVLKQVSWEFLPMNASLRGTMVRSLTTTQVFTPTGSQFMPILVAPRVVQPLWWIAASAIGLATLYATMSKPGVDRDVDRDLALVLVAALLISPLGWIYYEWFAVGPFAAVASRCQERISYRTWFFTGIAVAAFWPIPLLTAGQPSGLLTVSIGSAYFWAMLVLWLLLLGASRPTVAPVEAR